MPGKLVLPLAEAFDVKAAGGKAAALAELIKAGFNVPAGFVITTSAGADDMAAALDEFDKLGAETVAVRSSAASEDGAKDAWAGQLDTFLNVTRDTLLEKTEACRGSAASARAKAYAKQKKVSAGKVAVIVQKMIPARISGVAFSVHPVTHSRAQMVIEAVHGLGEGLVSGTATPDTYVVDKKTGEIIEKYLLSKQPILSSPQLKELTDTVRKIEEISGFPVDVEWALSGGQLFILQSRPVTALG